MKDILWTGEPLKFYYKPKLYINVYGTEYPLTEKQVHKMFEGVFSGDYDELLVKGFRKIINEEEEDVEE